MENYLIKINCDSLLTEYSEMDGGVSSIRVKSLKDIDFDHFAKKDANVILLLSIKDINHLQDIIQQRYLEVLNIPTIFILDSLDSEMIDLLYSKHFINLYLKETPRELLRKQIEYMFQNYNYYTSLKSSKVLATIETTLFTNKEVEIIRLLAESPLREINRNELYMKVWGSGHINTNTLDVHLCNIRRKLKTSAYNISSLATGKISLNRCLT
jgi:hypothetical protein